MTNGTNTETYSYDAVGNRTMSGYVTGAFNRLMATNSNTYEYNANGSIRRRSSAIDFGWDRENRLVTASNGDTRQFAYDALGRRVSSLFTPLIGELDPPVPERYTYDGLDVILDDNTDSDRPSVHYQNAPGIDNKLAMTNDGRWNYLLQDHLGSTVGLTGTTGTVTESNSYDSFGNPTNSSFPTRYQFTGREFDTFSGLQYSRARFYDPQIGRFISEDPIGFEGGDVNLYAYVWNDPMHFTDPSGEIALAPVVYAVFEICATGYDAYDFGSTLFDPNADWTDVALSGGGVAIGAVLPGGGYGPSVKGARKYFSAPEFPGLDPSKAPKGYEWKGKPGSAPGSKDGNFHNPRTRESLRPDLNHEPPIGPHWDYRDPQRKWWRVHPDGSSVPK